MGILDGSIVNVALPRMMAIFNVGTEDIQWVLTAYLLVSGVVVPVTGYLGDRFGYKRVYLISLTIFTVGSGLCAAAWIRERVGWTSPAAPPITLLLMFFLSKGRVDRRRELEIRKLKA